MVQENIDENQKRAEKFEAQYNKLRQEFKDYIETSKKNEEKRRLEIRSDTTKRLLVVADSLTRMAGSENDCSCELIKNQSENIRKNLSAIYSQMLQASGLTPVEPGAGDKFDEQKHIAIGLEYDTKYPENTVFRVVRKGYLLENMVIRPAEVIVSKGFAPQRAMKEGLWNRIVRSLMPEKARLSEMKLEMDEFERIQKEKMGGMAQDVELLKNSMRELNTKVKQTNEIERLQEEKMDKILLEIESLRKTLDEQDYVPETTAIPEPQIKKLDKIPWI